jgi:hypothetical protein
MTKLTNLKTSSRFVPRRHLNAAVSTDSREARRSQVRERLLRMILDNEEVRRNDQRPNAS